MSACVVMISDPFKTEQGRSVVPVTHALSVRDWLNEQGIVEFQNPTLCQYNGLSVLRADWSNTIIRDGDIVTFLPLPLGGGGGGGVTDVISQSSELSVATSGTTRELTLNLSAYATTAAVTIRISGLLLLSWNGIALLSFPIAKS